MLVIVVLPSVVVIADDGESIDGVLVKTPAWDDKCTKASNLHACMRHESSRCGLLLWIKQQQQASCCMVK